MKRTSSIVLIIGVSLALLTACSKRDKVVGVGDEDPEMVAAIAKARSTLPQFWQAFEKRDRGETNFSLKIRITDNKRIEHFWVTDIERQDGKVMGTNCSDGSRRSSASECSKFVYRLRSIMAGRSAAPPGRPAHLPRRCPRR
jgi:major membrane immunogen (membrane-anchored lipoprotein)